MSSFNTFASSFAGSMQDQGDYTRVHTIDPAFWKCIGDVKGKKCHDIGCGNGYIARQFLQKGAQEVWGSDLAPSLIEIAAAASPTIHYRVADATDMQGVPEEYFDLVTMHLVVFYIHDIDALFSSIAKILKKDGRFVFTTDHILRELAYVRSGAEPAEGIYETYEQYLDVHAFEIINHWKHDEKLTRYRRPLSDYINTAAKHGLYMDQCEEPATDIMIRGEIYQTSIPSKVALGFIKK